jgi:hypothetical protein
VESAVVLRVSLTRSSSAKKSEAGDASLWEKHRPRFG